MTSYQAKEDFLWFKKDQVVDKIELGWESYFTELKSVEVEEQKKKPFAKKK